VSAEWASILGGLGGVETSDGLEGNIFLSVGVSPSGPPPDVWVPINLTQFGIPADAVCVDVSGLLIITMGNIPGWSNLCIAFRKPGDASVKIRNDYVFQCVANTGDGMRTNSATVLTPVNGVIEWGWFWSGQQPGWPSGPALAANLSFTRWMK
jgi:hypothetical protein